MCFNRWHIVIISIILFSIMTILVGCGGGGSGGGTSNSLSVEITSPTENITIGQGESINFQAEVYNGTAPYTYSWNFDGGATNSTLKDPGDVLFNSAGTYNIRLTVTDSKNTTVSSSQLVVSVLPALSVSIVSPANNITIHSGESVNFQAQVSGGTAPYTYSWDFDGAAKSSTLKDPGSITFNKIGIYNITFSVTDTDGTTKNSSITVTVPNYISGSISSDTTWSKDESPYILEGDVRIDQGVTVTVDPGTIIRGDSSLDKPEIVVWGTLNAIGGSSDRILFENIHISSNGNECTINIRYAFCSYPFIIVSYNDHNISDSIFYKSTGISASAGSGKVCYFERNTLINCGAIQFNTEDEWCGDLYVRNNVFYSDSSFNNYTGFDSAVSLATRPNKTVFKYNSLLINDGRYSIAAVLGDFVIDVTNNYWGTTDTDIIDEQIYDGSDIYPPLAGYANYEPFLTSPHANTPDHTPYIE